jgi:hypothetical protein
MKANGPPQWGPGFHLDGKTTGDFGEQVYGWIEDGS